MVAMNELPMFRNKSLGNATWEARGNANRPPFAAGTCGETECCAVESRRQSAFAVSVEMHFALVRSLTAA